MRFSDNVELTAANMAGADILAGTDVSADADKKFSLAGLGDWFLSRYNGQTLAGSSQSVKSAIDGLKNDKVFNRSITGFQYSEIASIQDASHHIAFPSIIYANSKYYLAYRQGTSHADYDGVIVVKSGSSISDMGDETVVSVTGEDCRDPKFVVFNSTLHMFFTTRTSGSNNKVYYVTYSGSAWTPPVYISFAGLSSVFCGGRPIVNSNTIYIPIYSGTTCYLAYGTSLSNLTVRTVSENGNECSLIYTGSEYLCVVRNATSDKNGFVVRISNISNPSTDKVSDLGFSCHCPELVMVNKIVVLCYRSNNASVNFNNFTGELNVCLMTMTGDMLNTFYNLFAGNNTDIGYASSIVVSGNLYIAFYLNFCHRIIMMKQSVAKIGEMQGVDSFYSIGSLIYPTSPKGYQFKYPLGVRALGGVNISIPSTTESVIKTTHIWFNNTSSNPTKFFVYHDSTQTTLTTVLSAIIVWTKHYLVADYNGWDDNAGKITEL